MVGPGGTVYGPPPILPIRKTDNLRMSKLLFDGGPRPVVVTFISSKPRVYLLKDGDPVGQSASRSVEFSKWTLLIGRTGFAIRHHTFDTKPDTQLQGER